MAAVVAPLRTVRLDDKYALASGSVLMSGTQALVRLPLLQRAVDQAAGLNTAGFITGYRGSPLGAYDMELWGEAHRLKEAHVVFQPGVNEDLAATSIWGTQQLNLFPKARYDGVFSMWYGKGPGVDRCGDVFKHANAAGTSKHGGVLVLAGDDHAAKSSTLPFARKLADLGWQKALRADSHLANGLNVHEGQITNAAVAKELGYKHIPVAAVL